MITISYFRKIQRNIVINTEYFDCEKIMHYLTIVYVVPQIFAGIFIRKSGIKFFFILIFKILKYISIFFILIMLK